MLIKCTSPPYTCTYSNSNSTVSTCTELYCLTIVMYCGVELTSTPITKQLLNYYNLKMKLLGNYCTVL